MNGSRKKWNEGEFLSRIAELRGARDLCPEHSELQAKARELKSRGGPREAAALWFDAARTADEPYLCIAQGVDLLLTQTPREIRGLARSWPEPGSQLGSQILGLALLASGSSDEGEDALIRSLVGDPVDVQGALLAARSAAYIDRGAAETFLGELATRDIGPKGREVVYGMLDDLSSPPPSARNRGGDKREEAWLLQALSYSEDGSEPTAVAMSTEPVVGPSGQTEMDLARSVNALIRHLEGEADDAAIAQGGKEVARRYLRWNPQGRWEKARVREHPKERPGMHQGERVPVLQLQVILQDCKEPNALLVYLGYQQSRKVNRLIDRRTSPAELLEMMRDQDLPLFQLPVEADGKLIVQLPVPDLMPEHARCQPGDTLLVLTWSGSRAEATEE